MKKYSERFKTVVIADANRIGVARAAKTNKVSTQAIYMWRKAGKMQAAPATPREASENMEPANEAPEVGAMPTETPPAGNSSEAMDKLVRENRRLWKLLVARNMEIEVLLEQLKEE